MSNTLPEPSTEQPVVALAAAPETAAVAADAVTGETRRATGDVLAATDAAEGVEVLVKQLEDALEDVYRSHGMDVLHYNEVSRCTELTGMRIEESRRICDKPALYKAYQLYKRIIALGGDCRNFQGFQAECLLVFNGWEDEFNKLPPYLGATQHHMIPKNLAYFEAFCKYARVSQRQQELQRELAEYKKSVLPEIARQIKEKLAFLNRSFWNEKPYEDCECPFQYADAKQETLELLKCLPECKEKTEFYAQIDRLDAVQKELRRKKSEGSR